MRLLHAPHSIMSYPLPPSFHVSSPFTISVYGLSHSSSITALSPVAYNCNQHPNANPNHDTPQNVYHLPSLSGTQLRTKETHTWAKRPALTMQASSSRIFIGSEFITSTFWQQEKGGIRWGEAGGGRERTQTGLGRAVRGVSYLGYTPISVKHLRYPGIA